MYSRKRPVVGQCPSSHRSALMNRRSQATQANCGFTEFGSTTVIKNGNSIIE